MTLSSLYTKKEKSILKRQQSEALGDMMFFLLK
jgi:hypothetical protein